jgi:hypothetical protein
MCCVADGAPPLVPPIGQGWPPVPGPVPANVLVV